MARLLSRVGIDRLALGVVVVCCGAAAGAAPAGRTLMRYPTLHGGTIVFVAPDNLWSVPRSGGTASRLTAGEGRDVMPRFSPDGRWIAFTGEYQGNRDVYVMPAGGGAAQRLTFTSDVVSDAPLRWGPNNMVIAWTPDSQSIVFLSRREACNHWISRLTPESVSPGMPQPLPPCRATVPSYSPRRQRTAQ